MNDQKLALDFCNFACELPGEVLGVSSALEFQSKLLKRGYIGMTISGLPREPFIAPVADDVYQLFVAYASLERLFKAGGEATHSAFLGDGALVIVAALQPPLVRVQVESAPQTRACLAYSSSIETTLDKYVWSWRQVMKTIVDSAS